MKYHNKTCGDCGYWARPYEPPNKWMAFRYWFFKMFLQPKYSDGKPIVDWITQDCPTDKYTKHGTHWDIYKACKLFKPKR